MVWAGQPLYLYYHTLSSVSDFAIGALAAAWVVYAPRSLARWNQRHWLWHMLPWLGLGLMLLVRSGVYHRDWPLLTGLLPLVGAASVALIILQQAFAPRPFLRLSAFRWLEHTGRYTYALYLFHGLTLLAAVHLLDAGRELGLPLGETGDWTEVFWFYVLTVAMAYPAARLSYAWFERPFLQLGKRFRRV
jgi:peptidoglycan/LPS O-acetylase OafA/YrhL